MSDVSLVVDWTLSVMKQYWDFCTSNFYLAIPLTLGLVRVVYKLIKKVFA